MKFTARAIPAPDYDGKPAWYGQYRFDGRCSWRYAHNQNNEAIHYASEEAAINGARFCAERDAL